MTERMRSTFSRCGRLVLFLGFMGTLAGCATAWTAKVTTYEAWNADLYQARYYIAATAEQQGSLEFESVADSVRVAMGAAGLVEGNADSRLQLSIAYSNPVTQRMEERVADPFYGGVQPYIGMGIGSGYFYNGIGFGGLFYSPRLIVYPVDIYENKLTLIIRDGFNSMNELYKVSVINESNSANLMEVIPYMVQAAFANFPGSNGSTQYIKIKRTK